MEWIEILSRWVHIGTAIVLVGGTVFSRFVVLPATESLADDARAAFRARVLGSWKFFVMIGILLFLVSGFYNYIKIEVPAHRGDGLYHGLMGTKIILALVVFFLASALVGRSAGLENFRRNARLWLGVIVLLSTIIVGIAGFLKVRGSVKATESAASTSMPD